MVSMNSLNILFVSCKDNQSLALCGIKAQPNFIYQSFFLSKGSETAAL